MGQSLSIDNIMIKINQTTKIVAIIIVTIATIVQWIILVERSWAAVWGWYKFQGYGGGGQITVGKSSQLLFYLLSITVAAVALILSGREDNNKTARICKKIARIALTGLVVGMIYWTIMLASPLVSFR